MFVCCYLFIDTCMNFCICFWILIKISIFLGNPKIEYSVQANGSVTTETSPKGINSINYQDSSLSGTSSESNLCNSPNVIVTCSSSDMCKNFFSPAL